MDENTPLIMQIESCYDCPRFKRRRAGHFLLDADTIAYVYTCTKAGREIWPKDGVKPPPVWCPLRSKQ